MDSIFWRQLWGQTWEWLEIYGWSLVIGAIVLFSVYQWTRPDAETDIVVQRRQRQEQPGGHAHAHGTPLHQVAASQQLVRGLQDLPDAPEFFPGPVAAALQHACSQDKCTLLYLHDTVEYFTTTLCNETVGSVIRENFVLSGGARAELAPLFAQLQVDASAASFVVLVPVHAPTTYRVGNMLRFAQPVVISAAEVNTPELLVVRLVEAVEVQDDVVGQLRVMQEVREAELELNRNLKQEQDQAYAAAVERDKATSAQRQRENAEKEADEAAAMNEEAEAAQRKQDALHMHKQRQERREQLLLALEPEPAVHEKASSVAVRIVLPVGGRKMQRSFLLSCELRQVFIFIESLNVVDDDETVADALCRQKYQLVSRLPARTVYSHAEHSGQTLQQLHLTGNCLLMVELMSEEEAP